MTETKKYPCEACLGLTPLKRIRCPKCRKLFCKYHIKNHSCNKIEYPLIPKFKFLTKDGKLELT